MCVYAYGLHSDGYRIVKPWFVSGFINHITKYRNIAWIKYKYSYSAELHFAEEQVQSPEL